MDNLREDQLEMKAKLKVKSQVKVRKSKLKNDKSN
jgi:hypothetical protein